MSDEMEWRSTTTVAKQPPTPPLLLAGYRLGVAMWLLIGEEDEPQFSNTYEYLIRSPRYHLHARPSDEVGDEAPVRRKLEGEASVWTNYILMQGENGQRMDCPSLKTAKGEVKRCEKVLDAALIELQKESLSLRYPHEHVIEEVFNEQGVAHFRVVGDHHYRFPVLLRLLCAYMFTLVKVL
ncbi:hypothetical protein Tco_0295290 [Tanacetum coccineum]